jgi:hypothetical protein
VTRVKADSVKQATLHRWFNYDAETGVFTWKEKPGRSIAVGAVAGSIQKQHGKMRRVLWVTGRRVYGARAAFIYVHGDIPDSALIDHADGDTTNDRISNLRMASTVQNVWNRLRSEGVTGVSKDSRGRFKSRIQLTGGTKINLGTWDTEAEASAAYLGAAAILHGDFSVAKRGDRSKG